MGPEQLTIDQTAPPTPPPADVMPVARPRFRRKYWDGNGYDVYSDRTAKFFR